MTPTPRATDCPPLPNSRVTVYQRTLHRACEVLGGLEQPPLDVFLKAVDVVLLGAERAAGLRRRGRFPLPLGEPARQRAPGRAKLTAP